jgi:hypothetical protein
MSVQEVKGQLGLVNMLHVIHTPSEIKGKGMTSVDVSWERR